MSIVRAILTDILSDESEWWEGELQTATGFGRAEFEDLFARSFNREFVPCSKDRLMLHQAANQLLGYPGVATSAVQALLGADWQDALVSFMKVIGRE